jgi:hypothetical protein
MHHLMVVKYIYTIKNNFNKDIKKKEKSTECILSMIVRNKG